MKRFFAICFCLLAVGTLAQLSVMTDTNGFLVVPSVFLKTNITAGAGVTVATNGATTANGLVISAVPSGVRTNLTVYSSNTTDAPLVIQPRTGATNHHFRILNTNGADVIWVNTNDVLTASNAVVLANAEIRGTNYEANLWVSNTVSQSLSTLAVLGSATNYQINFGLGPEILPLSTNVYFINSTNRPAGTPGSPERTISKTLWLQSYGADRQLYWNANWHTLGAPLPSTMPSNKLAILTFICVGASETNVAVGVSLEP